MAARRWGHVDLDLVIIGLAITLEPLTIVAFILILGSARNLCRAKLFTAGGQ
jgi:hypothetical protein